MTIELLATKLRIPPPSPHQVPRNRLVDALERGIPNYKIILVSAPAGYGKTTLLSQWANATPCRVAWLSLSAEDSDPQRFLRYLLAAWETVQPEVRQSKLGLLLSAQAPDTNAVLTAFINVANTLSEPLVFVLDDYHLIDDAAVHKALTFLLDNLPSTTHFVLTGRADPPLPLAQYRARHTLLEIRAEDLQFQADETANFLSKSMGLDLAEDRLVALQAQSEGWIAGLQLVALTLQRRIAGSSELIVSGRHRFIADYLSEDVLAPLPDAVQAFLLKTSILGRLCGPLCDAVTEHDRSQAMLEKLERENLFLVSLDERREWFRYHHLFSDFLLEELQRRHPETVSELHRRAAAWYLTQEMPEPAFQHAVGADAVDIAVQILDRYANYMLNAGELRVIERWVALLPAAWYREYPMFGLARAGLQAFNGEFEACTRTVDSVEQSLLDAKRDDEDWHWQMARVKAIRCLMACIRNDLTLAEDFADLALRELPEDNLGWRPGIYNALGDTYRQNGRWQDSKACYLEALAVTESPQSRFMSARVYGALADLALRQGHLRDAEHNWRQALATIEERESWGRLPAPVIGWVYIRLAELLYERDELAEAWDQLSRGLEHAELGGDLRSMIAAYLIAGRLKLSQGETDRAEDYLELARPLVERAQFAPWISRFERLQLEVWLAQDRLRAAVGWADQILNDGAIEQRPESEVAQLAMARVLIVKGDLDSIERALTLLGRLLTEADTEGRKGIAIESLVLQAMAHWKQDRRTDALTTLERALRMAEPEGYLRLFADLGLLMHRLLQEARSRDVLPDYVDRLLAASGADSTGDKAGYTVLPEPLTDREHEILKLVAAGLTNQEIAEKLVISAETVKKHASNIYGKLGVGNRTEASTRARELDLLE